MTRYTGFEDASRKLDGCIAMYKGKPFHCFTNSGRDRGKQLDLMGFQDGSLGLSLLDSVDYNDENLTFGGLNVGYVNLQGRNSGACYVVRYPARRMKNGLHTENVLIKTRDSDGRRGLGMDRIGNSHFQSKAMFDTINNKYPSLEEAIAQLDLTNPGFEVAFHRNFSIKKDEVGIKKISYMGNVIAFFDLKNNLRLPDRYLHFKDMIMRKINKTTMDME